MSHLFDVNVVVEVDQVSSLLFTITCSGGGRVLVGCVGGCGGGTARLWGRQGAAGANGNWTDVSTCWGENRGGMGKKESRGWVVGPQTLTVHICDCAFALDLNSHQMNT